MTRKPLGLCISLAFIGIMFANTIFAQQASFYQTYRDYISLETKGKHSTFIVLKNALNPAPYTFGTSTQILRQINDSVFIVRDVNGASKNEIKFPSNNYWKLSAGLLYKTKSKQLSFPVTLVISSDNLNLLDEHIQKKTFAIPSSRNQLLKNITETEFEKLLDNDHIQFISEYHFSPKEELQINNLDLSANRINQLHSHHPQFNGDGLVVSIKENKPDSTDIDLKGRFISNPLESQELSPHATIMATMAAGAGNSYYLGRGVAGAAGITSSSFSNLFPDPDAQYRQFRITVQNHSYGVGVENFYGADAVSFDESAIRNDSLLFVFSAGNSGLATSTSGIYTGVAGYANLTGSFKMAKNILTAGATDSFGTVAPQSSKGPAFDGRLKPELVAYGEDGSSGAAALVSGTAILLQEAYKKTHGNVFPPSELVKALILNTCDDVDRAGIDFNSGYGALNANRAMEEMLRGDFVTGNVTANNNKTFPLVIPSNIRRAKVLLTWKDPASAPNAFRAIINDLDLEVKNPAGSVTWSPWVLNSAPVKDSLMLLPVRRRDSLNTIEQVTIQDPVPGNYTITVKGANLKTLNQDFVLSFVFDTADIFEWNFPTSNDNIFPGTSNLLRWKNSYRASTGALEFSYDLGSTWSPIASGIDLNAGYYRWNAPDTNVNALLRMTVNSAKYSSDTFSISSRLNLRVGFNCNDSLLLFWNKVKGVDRYRLYGLGDRYLQAFVNISDTQLVVSKNSFTFSHFAVASLLSVGAGVKSYAIDYGMQGVGCYISNLTADLQNDNEAFIHLTVGTGFNITKVVLEKLVNTRFAALKIFDNISQLDFSFTDQNLLQGENIYRAAIYLSDGRIVYSYTTTVIYLSTLDFLAYPNPLKSAGNFTVQFKELHNQTIALVDGAGRLINSWTALNTTFTKVLPLPAGIYFLKVTDPERHTSQTIKIIIL